MAFSDFGKIFLFPGKFLIFLQPRPAKVCRSTPMFFESGEILRSLVRLAVPSLIFFYFRRHFYKSSENFKFYIEIFLKLSRSSGSSLEGLFRVASKLFEAEENTARFFKICLVLQKSGRGFVG